MIPIPQIGVDGKPLDGNATPRVKGYAYCATPQIEPGVSASPLMTWGEVESTPQRLESNTPSRHAGPAFKIPQVCAIQILPTPPEIEGRYLPEDLFL